MLKRIVDALQVVALVAVVITIGMLFRSGPQPDGDAGASLGPLDGPGRGRG